LEPQAIDWRLAKKVRQEAEDLLAGYGLNANSILDSLPKDLSAGARSISKLIAAQLYRNKKILILDEAFTNLQRDIWPFLLDSLRDWAHKTNSVVLAISHNPSEISRWQPIARYEIRDKKLIQVEQLRHAVIRAGVPSRNKTFPIFEIKPSCEDAVKVYQELWHYLRHVDKFMFLILERIKDHPSTQALINTLGASKKVYVEAVNIRESLDATKQFKRCASKVLLACSNEKAALVVVGGGLCLNFGGFVASVVHRGRMPLVLVPTTVLSMADVAVGSKTAINLGLGPQSDIPARLNVKHTLGTYINPTAVLLDWRYLAKLPEQEVKVGLVECLKHGLVQDVSLFSKAAELMEKRSVSAAEAYEAARRTLDLKSETLELDPWEDKYARLLLFGHLHAHAIERATATKISHGVAVMLGMLVEATLAHATEIRSRLLRILQTWNVEIHAEFWTFDLNVMEQIYESNNKSIFHSEKLFRVLPISEIGQFGLNRIREAIQTKERVGQVDFGQFADDYVSSFEQHVTWGDIHSAYITVRTMLDPEKQAS
jgi:3-dehydroquinate synthetase